jgi:predicted dehydrogenase
MLVPPDYYVRGRRYVGHLLATGAMGQIREVLSQRSMPTVIDPHADLAARQDAKMFGVINPLHLGLYWDVLAPWFGQPVRVLAHSTIFVPRRRHPDTGRLSAVELPDAITVIAEMESGATVLNSQSGVAVAGDNKIVIHGEEATLVYELASEQLFLARRGETELRPMDVPAEFEYRQRIGPDFAELLMTGSQPQGSTFDDGLRNIEYLTACYLSARTGRSVSMSELAEPGSVDLLSAQSPA